MKNLLHSPIRCILLLLGMLLFGQEQVWASHAMGADLTYSCLGNNQYRVRLQFYRDCNGINAATTETVQVSSSCANFSVTLAQISVTEITPVCPGITATACNGGAGVYGIQQFVYEATVTLPSGCTDWTMGWQLCCRNAAITTLNSPASNQMYIKATLNTAAASCNNSPIFLNNPTPFACVGQSVFYNHGAYDADGDQLQFSLANCYNSPNNPVTYNSAMGISASTPLLSSNGVSIDAATGAVHFIPSSTQIGVICVLVEEFRNGIKIGEVVRDIQFTIVNCSNQAPTLSGINGGSSYNTIATVGQQLCFNIISNDANAGQSLALNYNGAIPAAVFSSAGSPFPTGTFCWTPTANDVGVHSFTVQVRDNACPLVGQNTYTYTITVQAPPPPACNGLLLSVTNISDVQCNGHDGSAILTASGGSAPYTYTLINWTTGDVFSNQTGIFSNLSAGDYHVLVVDSNGCQPDCANNSFSIGGNVVPMTASVQVNNILCGPNSNYNGPNANNGGSINIIASGGSAPYLYSIGAGFVNSNTFNNLHAGSYQVVVMDANGCSFIQTATISAPAALYLNIDNAVAPTCSQNNGSISLSANGGTPSYSYYLNGAALSGNVINNLSPGTYSIRVDDSNLCVTDTVITLEEVPSFSISASASELSCHGDCDASATISASGANGLTFLWSNGAIGATIDNLCAGSYSVSVSDANGCQQVATVLIVEPAAIVVSLVSSIEETCVRNDGSVVLAATGGSGVFQYNLANISTGTTYSNNTGQFSGLAAGTYAYHISDGNGCTQECLGQFRLRYICRNDGTGIGTTGPSLDPVIRGRFIIVNPNPASTFAQVSYAAEGEASPSISILDAAGRLIEEHNGLATQGSLELNISQWATATYFVVLRGKDGKVIQTTRLVVSK